MVAGIILLVSIGSIWFFESQRRQYRKRRSDELRRQAERRWHRDLDGAPDPHSQTYVEHMYARGQRSTQR
jgi:hypothetical protein